MVQQKHEGCGQRPPFLLDGEMIYSLRNYYEEAGISPVPEWAGDVTLQFYDKDTGGMSPGRPRWHQVTGLSLL